MTWNPTLQKTKGGILGRGLQDKSEISRAEFSAALVDTAGLRSVRTVEGASSHTSTSAE